MRTDTELLEKKIEESGLKRSYIIKQLGITRQTFNNKCKNITHFRTTEAIVLANLLNMNNQEKTKIFFAEKDEL